MFIIIFLMYLTSLDINSAYGFQGTGQSITIYPEIYSPNIYIDKGWYTVYPLKPLYVTIANFNIQYINCRNHHTSHKFQCIITSHHESKSEMKISSVIDVMSGTWECSFKKQNESYKIYFDINVVDAKPPQSIIINNMVLPLSKNSNKYRFVYYYKDGEKVDIQCVSRRMKHCWLNLAFIFNTHYNVNYEPGSKILNKEHNNSHVTCTSTCIEEKKSTESITVIFILKSSINSMATRLLINNTEMVLTTEGEQPPLYPAFYVNYAYFIHGYFNIVCDLLKTGRLSIRSSLCDYKDQIDEITTMKLSDVYTKKLCKIIFTARNYHTGLEEIVIVFTKISVEEYDVETWQGFSSPTQTRPPENKIITTQTTTNDIGLPDNYTNKSVMFSTTTSTTMASVFTTIATDIDIQYHGHQYLISAIIGILIFIALAIGSITIYKRRKRKESKECLKTTDSVHEKDNAVISAVIPEESQYEIVKFNDEEIYAYATLPRAKFIEESQYSSEVPESNYANRNIFPIHEGKKKNHNSRFN